MRNLARTLALLSVIPAFSAAVAHADTMYNFTASITPYGPITATLPASPTPSSFTTTSFELLSVPVVVDGDTFSETVDFFTSAAGGGASGGEIRVDGDQLFTGSTSTPTFRLGTFTVGDFSVTISSAPSAVPEPSSLALLATGALGVVGVFRRKLSCSEHNA